MRTPLLLALAFHIIAFQIGIVAAAREIAWTEDSAVAFKQPQPMASAMLNLTSSDSWRH